MLDNVKCANCKEAIDEPTNLPPEDRKPCPKCGSTIRDFFISVAGIVSLESFGSSTIELISSPGFPSLLLQAVVVKGEKTSEGSIIEAVALPWFKIIGMLERDPSLAYQIPPRTWEEIIAGAYTQAGFEEVILTPASGDYGRDVIAVKKGLGSIRVIDQVKAYSPGNLVTADDARALMGVLQGDKASKGFLTTTADFAPLLHKDPLLVEFMPSRLELINGKMLLKRLGELAKNDCR